jgi:hypothetical protein
VQVKDVVKMVHQDLISEANVNKNKHHWQACGEDIGLECHIPFHHDETIVIRDMAQANQSSNLLLVPALLLTKGIISEEEKDLLYTALIEDPLIRAKQLSLKSELKASAEKTFAQNEAARIFSSPPTKHK